MRFMIIVKATTQTEAGLMPAPEVFEAMGKFNEELIEAADGMREGAQGMREGAQGMREAAREMAEGRDD